MAERISRILKDGSLDDGVQQRLSDFATEFSGTGAMSTRRHLEELTRILKQAREQVQQRGTPLPVVLVPAEEFEAAVAAIPPRPSALTGAESMLINGRVGGPRKRVADPRYTVYARS